MTRDKTSIAAIILSAGESRRMGSPKALLSFRGETFLDQLIRKMAQTADPVIVVLGHEAERIRSGIRECAEIAVNKMYTHGMLTSLQCGLRAVPDHSRHVLFTLVDHPNPADSTMAMLAQCADAPVVIPRYQGRKGHPVRISRKVAAEIAALPLTARISDVLHRYLETTAWLDVDDPGILDDIDDPAAYQELVARP